MKMAITQTEKFDIPLAFQSEKCDNVSAMLLLVRDESAMGFMSGGMVVGSVSKFFAITSLWYVLAQMGGCPQMTDLRGKNRYNRQQLAEAKKGTPRYEERSSEWKAVCGKSARTV